MTVNLIFSNLDSWNAYELAKNYPNLSGLSHTYLIQADKSINMVIGLIQSFRWVSISPWEQKWMGGKWIEKLDQQMESSDTNNWSLRDYNLWIHFFKGIQFWGHDNINIMVLYLKTFT